MAKSVQEIERSAVFSDCGRFRYVLFRKWDLHKQWRKRLYFFMLNPSIADSSVDDPTIRKCMGFAERNGFNEIGVMNLFAYCATNPDDLKNNGYQQGPDNYLTISQNIDSTDSVVLAWGAHARGLGAPEVAIARLRSRGARLFVLKLLDDGTPAHPLMLPYSCKLQLYLK